MGAEGATGGRGSGYSPSITNESVDACARNSALPPRTTETLLSRRTTSVALAIRHSGIGGLGPVRGAGLDRLLEPNGQLGGVPRSHPLQEQLLRGAWTQS